jgi:hypothetical protein
MVKYLHSKLGTLEFRSFMFLRRYLSSILDWCWVFAVERFLEWAYFLMPCINCVLSEEFPISSLLTIWRRKEVDLVGHCSIFNFCIRTMSSELPSATHIMLQAESDVSRRNIQLAFSGWKLGILNSGVVRDSDMILQVGVFQSWLIKHR